MQKELFFLCTKLNRGRNKKTLTSDRERSDQLDRLTPFVLFLKKKK